MDILRYRNQSKILLNKLRWSMSINQQSTADCELVKVKCKPYSEIPGPKGALGIGTFYKYYPCFGTYSWSELHTSGMQKYKEYGPIIKERLFPGTDLLFLYNPDDIATLLNDSSAKGYPQRRSHLALAKYRKDRPHIYGSAGLLPTNGPEWWRLRSQLQKGISSPKCVRGFLNEVDNVTSDFVDKLKTNSSFDILPELARLNLELTCLLAFNERMNSFSDEERQPTSKTSQLMHATKTSNSCILPTDQSFFWRLFETPTYKQLRKSQEYIESLAIDFVSRKIKHYQEETKDNGAKPESQEGCSIFEEYLRNPNLDLSDIVGMAADLLMAGVETTTFTLSFALYHLAKHPEVQEKVYMEACNVLHKYDDSLTPDILNNKIPYTRAVLKESLRINPISIGVGRILNADTIFSGYFVPEGTIVVTQNMVACRLETNFKDPYKFQPDRWAQRRNNIHPHLLLPFGHGMRSCIARRMAEQNMLVLLLRIMRNYSIKWDGVKELGVKTYLINNPDSSVDITLYRRPCDRK